MVTFSYTERVQLNEGYEVVLIYKFWSNARAFKLVSSHIEKQGARFDGVLPGVQDIMMAHDWKGLPGRMRKSLKGEAVC